MLLFFAGCTKSIEPERVMTPLEKQGQLVYVTNCLSCHNSDPTKPGSLGPDIAGTSIEILTIKIKGLPFPSTYVPKRTTHMMPALPFVEKDIPAIHAYLSLFIKK